jgi:hypothetical protein
VAKDGSWHGSRKFVLPERELNKRGRQQRQREQDEWERRNKRPERKLERKQSARREERAG